MFPREMFILILTEQHLLLEGEKLAILFLQIFHRPVAHHPTVYHQLCANIFVLLGMGKYFLNILWNSNCVLLRYMKMFLAISITFYLPISIQSKTNKAEIKDITQWKIILNIIMEKMNIYNLKGNQPFYLFIWKQLQTGRELSHYKLKVRNTSGVFLNSVVIQRKFYLDLIVIF